MRIPVVPVAIASLCALLLAACGTAAPSASHQAATKASSSASSATATATSATAATAPNVAVPAGPPHPSAQGTVKVTLPVHKLPTSFAAQSNRTVPSSVTVTIPAAWQGAVDAYWSGTVLLGPAGWTGKGTYGADGSGGVTLYPPGADPSSGPYHGPYLSVTTAGGCLGCGDASAASFFSYVRDNWSQFQVVNGPAPKAADVLSQVALSPNIVAYRLPNTNSLEVNGVAYSGLVNHASQLPFEQMNVALPSGDHGLATVVLNYFLAHDLTQLP